MDLSSLSTNTELFGELVVLRETRVLSSSPRWSLGDDGLGPLIGSSGRNPTPLVIGCGCVAVSAGVAGCWWAVIGILGSDGCNGGECVGLGGVLCECVEGVDGRRESRSLRTLVGLAVCVWLCVYSESGDDYILCKSKRRVYTVSYS